MTKTSDFYTYQPHFFGGMSKYISEGLRNYRYYNAEDIDIYSDPNFIQPSLTFQADDNAGITKVTGFTVDSSGKLYELGENTTPKAIVYKKDTPTGATPSSWTNLFTSANAPATQGYSPITSFQTTESGNKVEYLYYHTGANILSRYGNLKGTPTETASFGTLSGLESSDVLVDVVYNSELFVANGGYVARVTSQGNFVDQSYTLPTGLRVVDMTPMVLTTGGDYMAILCKDTTNQNISYVVIWDMVATSGFIAKIRVPLAKPQWIQKIGTSFLVGGVNPNNQFEVYAMAGLIVTDSPIFIISHVDYTYSHQVSPPTTKSTIGNLFHFGLKGIERAGIFAISEVKEDLPAISLLHRCSATDYTKHIPMAFCAVADCKYISYYDDTDSNYHVGLANAQDPHYSSNAILETLLYNNNSAYTDKKWTRFQIGLEPLPSECSIGVYARKNMTNDYAYIDVDNQKIDVPATERADMSIVGFSGSGLQLKLEFTSKDEKRAQVKWIAISGEVTYLH